MDIGLIAPPAPAEPSLCSRNNSITDKPRRGETLSPKTKPKNGSPTIQDVAPMGLRELIHYQFYKGKAPMELAAMKKQSAKI